VRDVIINDLGTGGNAGLGFACQANGTLSNISLTGDMISLYIDTNVTVTGYNFTPGPQVNPRGFAITGPSDHITIQGFRSSGQGGVIANRGQFVAGNPAFVVDTVTLKDYALTGSPTACNGGPCHLEAGDVDNLTIEPSGPLGYCSFGGSGYLAVAPLVRTSNLHVNGCSLAQTTIDAAPSATVSGSAYNGVTFAAEAPPTWSFNDASGTAATVQITGGRYQNCPGSLVLSSRQLTFNISGLAGYPC
jgi:hypothetical protein